MSKPKGVPITCLCGCNQIFTPRQRGKMKYIRGHSPHIWKKRKPPITIDFKEPVVDQREPERCEHCGHGVIGLERTFDLESPTTLWEYYWHCAICGWTRFLVTESVAVEVSA